MTEQPLWAGQKEGRSFTRIEVTTMLNGATLAVPLHVVTGRHPGPTFGIVTNTHGDEFLPTIAIRQMMQTLDTGIGLVKAGPGAFQPGFGPLGLPGSYIQGKK